MNLSASTIAELRELLLKAKREVTSTRFLAEGDRAKAIESAARAQEEEASYVELRNLLAQWGITE